MDGGSARDKVEELGDLAVKRGCPNRVHGGDKYVVGFVAFQPLYEERVQGSVDAVPDSDERCGERGAVPFDDKVTLSECGALLG